MYFIQMHDLFTQADVILILVFLGAWKLLLLVFCSRIVYTQQRSWLGKTTKYVHSAYTRNNETSVLFFIGVLCNIEIINLLKMSI